MQKYQSYYFILTDSPRHLDKFAIKLILALILQLISQTFTYIELQSLYCF
uniref:Uncharacterized protein n=1 Tax=Heterorhabditis bacteriophora TaxID=37862 RepID=A0A1I7WIJ6_HETBA